MLPKHGVRPFSTAIVATQNTALGRLIGPVVSAHPAESGFLLYNTGEGAIQARVALADVAESSIDAQYFEWAGDELGRILLDRVIGAADRGVRVRLLIDDYMTSGHDIAFAVLDAHPNIEVRVFNPFVRGRFRLPQHIGRWTELNHRMHNKMFVVDGQVAVIGGRNLADEYFGIGREIDYRDFDLLAIGEVVSGAEAGFDRYWNSEWAYPITTLQRAASLETLRQARERFEVKVAADRAGFPYRLPLDRAEALGFLERFRGQVIWGLAEVVYDEPSVMAAPLQGEPTTVGRKLGALVADLRHDVVIENAYLVPDEDLTLIGALRARNVQVQVLTNSLATTDVVAVNAAYSKSRPALVKSGVALYEMKPNAASRRLYVARPDSSRARLAVHGKAAVFDGEVVFLGSFNLDPRSMYLDTEAVFVVRSAALAKQVLKAFAVDFEPSNAWRIGIVTGKDEAVWVTDDGVGVEVEPHDPAGFWRRVRRSLFAELPIRPYL